MWNKKVVAVLLAAVLMAGGAIGGTVAWLVAQTPAVVNTFTYGDINITLEETDTNDGDNDPNTNQYKMLPGSKIAKDPKVTVLADSEACYLFVKLEKSAGFDDFMTYNMADGWIALEGTTDVFYRTVEADTDSTGVTYDVLQANEILVKDTVTKEMLNQLTTYPTLTITAYAVQKDNVDNAAAAWSHTQPSTNP